MLPKFLRALWGDLTAAELKMFGLLSSALFFIVGTYWMMRTMKNAIFMETVGSGRFLGYAKMISPIVLIVLVLIYSKLIDLFEKQKLVYIIAPFYATIFLAIAYCLSHPVLSKSAILGWVTYFTVESFASLVVALFWSFVASSMDTATAKRGFPVIVFGAQIGSVLGNILDLNASTVGLAGLFLIAGLGVLIVPFIIKAFVTAYPAEPAIHSHEERKSTGVVEGLRLLLAKPYLMGVLVCSITYEIIATIFDIQMNTLALQHYGSVTRVVEFIATYGLLANILSLVFSFVGTSFLIRTLGLRYCLPMFPLVMGCLVIGAWIFPGLWMFFAAMVITRGLTYALNNPCRDMMYIPTSRDVRFKTKGWVDTFGSRSAKGLGGFIFSFLFVIAPIISLALAGAWAVVAVFVGKKNHELVEQNKIIE